MDAPNDYFRLALPTKIVIEQISERIRNGEILLAAVQHLSKYPEADVNKDDIAQTFTEWLDRTEEILKLASVGSDLLKGFTRLTPSEVRNENLLDAIDRNLRDNLNNLDMLIQKIKLSAEKNGPETERLVPVTKDVFIIHGHDEANRMRLQKMIEERFGLKTHLMIREPGKGRTLIEKFEEEAQLASFAFALLTPDDLVRVRNSESEYAQARPNAIFELGWFYGRLGRRRIAILFKKDTHLHSDLAGISRIEFSNSVEECIGEIERELKAAGMIS
jgi:predicted nucleotide-binding protein